LEKKETFPLILLFPIFASIIGQETLAENNETTNYNMSNSRMRNNWNNTCTNKKKKKHAQEKETHILQKKKR